MNKKAILVLLLVAALIVSGCITGDAKGGKGAPSNDGSNETVKGKGGGANNVPAAQCGDGIDNDGDGYCDVDHKRTKCNDGSIPGDVDCSSSDDNSEAPDCSIACELTSECGTDGTVGTPYCQNGNVYQDSIAYICQNGGTCDAACSSDTSSNLIESCEYGCTSGACDAAPENETNETGDVDFSFTVTASPSTGVAPLTVTFTSTVYDGNTPFTYVWDLGDGNTANVKDPSHTYATAGTYNVIATFTDADGDTHQQTKTIVVTDEVNPDQLSVTLDAYPLSGPAPLVIKTTSVITGGNPTSFTYLYGDNTFASGSSIDNGEHYSTHTYFNPGTYTISLEVNDADGTSQYVTKTVTVQATETNPIARTENYGDASIPTVDFSVTPTSGPAPLIVDAQATVLNSIAPFSYSFSRGDGSGYSSSDSTNGNTKLDSATYDTPGTYIYYFTAIDVEGNMITKYVPITVTENTGQTGGDFTLTATPSTATALVDEVIFTHDIDFETTWYSMDHGDGTGAGGTRGISYDGWYSRRTYQNPGTYTAILKVRGVDGNLYSSSTQVIVS